MHDREKFGSLQWVVAQQFLCIFFLHQTIDWFLVLAHLLLRVGQGFSFWASLFALSVLLPRFCKGDFQLLIVETFGAEPEAAGELLDGVFSHVPINDVRSLAPVWNSARGHEKFP